MRSGPLVGAEGLSEAGSRSIARSWSGARRSVAAR